MRPLLRCVVPLLLAACGREELVHELDERQASEVVVALDEGGIRARKVRPDAAEGSYSVEVAGADVPRALRILAERDLPRPRPPGLGEVFGKGGLVPTPTEERALFQHAVAGELARSLESVEGVVGARVHLGLAEEDPLRPAERPLPRASVLVRCRPSACEAVRALEPGVRALVAGAADRLEESAVSVIITEAREAPRPLPPPAPRSGFALALAAAAGIGSLAALGFWLRIPLRGRSSRSPVPEP
jgi:type III secretion protein J